MVQKQEKVRNGKPSTGQATERSNPENRANDIVRNIFCIIALQISHNYAETHPQPLYFRQLILRIACYFICSRRTSQHGRRFYSIGSFSRFFDGMLARLLNVDGELGKQLDSLADLITFGVAPAFIVFQLFFWIEDQKLF